jgi:glycosyltransferase involved in cell wall biosynthesis
MFYNHSIAIVIPAYRVERWIVRVISNLPDFVDEIIVVDDASPDNLARVVTDLELPNVTLLRHTENLGVGGAMKTGYKEALRLGVDLVVKMDGDDQMDPQYLGGILFPLVKDESDYVKGNRFGLISDVSNMPVIRRIGNLLLSLFTKFVSGYWHVVDSQNGYQAVKSKVLRKLNFNWIDNSYFFENSMLLNLNIIEARVSDINIPSRYIDEESSMSILNIIFRFPFKLFKGFFSRITYRYLYRDFSPIFVFLFIGLLSLGGGIIWGGLAWYNSVVYNHEVSLGTFGLGLVPILLGSQMLLSAMIMDIQQSPVGKQKLYDYTEKELAEIGKNNPSN